MSTLLKNGENWSKNGESLFSNEINQNSYEQQPYPEAHKRQPTRSHCQSAAPKCGDYRPRLFHGTNCKTICTFRIFSLLRKPFTMASHLLIEVWKRINLQRKTSLLWFRWIWSKWFNFFWIILENALCCKQIEIRSNWSEPLESRNVWLMIKVRHISPKYPIGVPQFHGKLQTNWHFNGRFVWQISTLFETILEKSRVKEQFRYLHKY